MAFLSPTADLFWARQWPLRASQRTHATNPATRAERLRRLSVIQRTFDPLPLDDDVAASYGLLAAAVVAAGRQPRARVMDLLIAATAHAHNATLYTRNPGDLVGVDHLIPIITV